MLGAARRSTRPSRSWVQDGGGRAGAYNGFAYNEGDFRVQLINTFQILKSEEFPDNNAPLPLPFFAFLI